MQGFLGVYPHQGVVEVSDSLNNKLTVSANQVVNSSDTSIKFNSAEPLLSSWLRLTDGNYWKIPGITLRADRREFRHDNFQALALNYLQQCGGKAPAMRGKIRFNSSYPW